MKKLLFLSIISVAFSGCTWFSVENYVSVTVDNRTAESLSVQTGEDFISFSVAAKSAAVHQVVKSKALTARGAVSETTYGPRYFTADGETWTIYD